MTAPDQATARQHEAAHPQASVWLTANAGSGKTKVLTDRVARLLLEGVEPQNVLCLTYTKAAAAEMQNRLFQRLGAWAMLNDAALRAELVKLGVEGAMPSGQLRRARTLFARALETPGGLRIQTIHAFCAALLRRFPLEAGVSPQFTEMEERQIQLLRAAVVESMAEGPDTALVQAVAEATSDNDLDKLTADVVSARDLFEAAKIDALDAAFGLTQGDNQARLLADVFDRDDLRLIAEVASACAKGSPTDVKAAELLGGVRGPDLAALVILEKVLLTGDGAKQPFTAKVGKFPTKDTRKGISALIGDLEDLMLRVQDNRDRRMTLAVRDRATVLINFARAFLPAYDVAKRDHGALDFDDLIRKARGLLNDPSVAQWVLYRLDGGIDHILVDEAQDTSPAQWQVIDRLTQEFGAGEGARSGLRRTVFVVGDRKQSIYSFQGADPDAFDGMAATFGERLRQIGDRLNRVEMQHSFRSAPVILDAVDRVLGPKANQGLGGTVRHAAFHDKMPGRIDLWPALEPAAEDKSELPWYQPVDQPSRKQADIQLAETIADEILRMTQQEAIPDSENGFAGRPVTEGDFLILVQRRSLLFAEIIRACKARGLRIAGADRLRVGAETAVNDIAAVLRFLSLPEDDLSLAEALRSPIFGWSEQDLFTLAHHRGERQFLWHALRDQKALHAKTLGILHDLLGRADFLRPYDLISRLLIRHGGRQLLLARLGAEAEDGIDVLLSQALAYEQSSVPSLTGFLDWMQTEDVEFKRQMDAREDRIRVMTVHGAKGLESPIVILPDTYDRRDRPAPPVMRVGDQPAWSPKADDTPASLRDALAARRARDQEERQRLLYVAMTRAEKWLIVCGAKKKDSTDGWLPSIEEGLRNGAGAIEVDQPTGRGLRLADPRWAAMTRPEPKRRGDAPPAPAPLPPIPAADPAPAPLSPSGLGGAKVIAGDSGEWDDMALQRGTWLHALLEHLPKAPPDQRVALGQAVLSLSTPAPDGVAATALVDRVCALIADPALAAIFTGDALVEVGFAANLPAFGGQKMAGAMDRLIVTPDCVTVVDYKSNRLVPDEPKDVPAGILRQMAAYAASLRQIYPERRIETAILWTETGKLMALPHDLVSGALS